MKDFYPSPGMRCKKHKDIGISYCNLCAIEHERDEIERLEKRNALLENVADAARYFMQNDKTGGLTGSKQVVDALEALDE